MADQEAVLTEDTEAKPRKRSRRLGGNRGTRSGATALEGASKALDELKTTDQFIERNKMKIVFLAPKDIKKNFNARFIPCSLEEFASIQWPSLEYDIDAVADLYPALLDERPWYKELSDIQKGDFITFLQKVHAKAQSICTGRQIHPITAERENAAAEEAFIIDGEVRTLSVLYSRGDIPYVQAQIYDYILDDETRARLKDDANDALELRPFETLDSKLARLDANKELMGLSLRPLGKELRVNKDWAAIIKDVAKHPERKKVFARIQRENLSWANMRFVLDNGVDAVIPKSVSAKDKQQGTTPKATPKADKAFTDHLKKLSKSVGGNIGYGCAMKYNATNDTVKLSLDCPKEKLDELLSLIGYKEA